MKRKRVENAEGQTIGWLCIPESEAEQEAVIEWAKTSPICCEEYDNREKLKKEIKEKYLIERAKENGDN